MVKFSKIIIGLVLLVSLALALSYCSSKSSDDSGSTDSGSTGAASAGAGASASSAAIRSATMGLSATADSAGAPSLGKAKNLSEAVNGFYNGLRAKRAEASALKAKFSASAAPYSAPSTTNCAGGGTMTTNTVMSSTDITMTTTYANCTTVAGAESQAQNGTVVVAVNILSLSFTVSMGTSTTPYTLTSTRLFDNTVVQNDVTTMTLTGTLDPAKISCGTTSNTDYAKLTFNMDGNMRSTGISNNAAYDESSVFTAFQLVVQNSALDNTCTATAGTIAESGQLSYTNNLGSLGTETMNIAASPPLTLTWASVTTGTTGDSYNISGTVSMVTPCFTGSFTLATPTAMFIPTNADCPTAGEVLVSGDVTGTVVYTSTGGVEIKDGSGAVVETHASCNEAQACI